ncbi:hypothetical protein M9H77_19300 [Catharanthus roseus]|uniref:Uncharacterized protein n=1 Tax=Catharanthus roseus TaxID=4058 RepID=A0ACC0BA06_CATRO|nr:hypothetical protein M9H77_19300 [Catharanthus roseus]
MHLLTFKCNKELKSKNRTRGAVLYNWFTFMEVNSVRGSDGELLASGGHDKEPNATHEGHSMVITDVRFSPALGFLATSSIDKTVRVWDTDNFLHHCVATFAAWLFSSYVYWTPLWYNFTDFHPIKDDLICSCDWSGEIRYWTINDGSCAGVFKGGNYQVRFQPCLGRYLAAASDDVLSIMDVEKQTCLYSMKGHIKPISYLCWDPSGTLLASLSEDSIRIWTFTPGNEGRCVHQLNGENFFSCAFHPTHPWLLASLVIWDTIENKRMSISAHKGIISWLAASGVSGFIASTSHDNFLKLRR